eukprot:Seg2508.3 transcript_id=Seg2508.3/GoldUCD/mRNA.D3Y31 product=Melanopsin protein_id=Seg2508.3/GoldUCD/D3Y31
MASCIHNLEVPTIVTYTLATVNIIQGLASTIGNFIVFFIIVKSKRLHTRSNVCLMSLATTDLLVGLVLEPLHIMQLFSAEYRSNCQFNTIRRFLATLFMGASIGSIAVVSYDRYKHLSETFNYRQCMKKKKIALLLMLSWLVPLAMPFSRYINEVVYKVVIIVYISMIIAIMITCYIFIIRIVKNREHSLRVAMTHSNSRAGEMKNHIRAAKAIVLVIVFLLITFAPLAIYFAVVAISSLLKKSIFMSATSREIGYACCMTVAMANSAVNPVIYYLRIPEFRASLKRYARSLCPGFRGVARNESRSDDERETASSSV